MYRKTTTIFRQLIINVVFPAVVALLILGVINYQNTKKILVESSVSKNHIISDEIIKVLEFQDVALDVLEQNLDKKIKNYSNIVVNKYLSNTKNIDKVDLYKVRKEVGMDPDLCDIYVINSKGIVINTTYKKDMNLNIFKFGDEHKNMLLDILKNKKFKNERFAIEASTRRLRKYTYQATNDGKYIIEIGIYSQKADEIINFIRATLKDIAKKQESINSVDLFIGAGKPFSLDKSTKVKETHKKILYKAFQNKDTITFVEKENGLTFNYEYIYMYRKNTELYKNAVIRIVSDKTSEIVSLRNELIKFFIIFGITLFVVILLIYKKTRVITDPIKHLVNNVNRITNGHLNERAEVVGNNEIATLSQKFNMMISELESYYYELEQKVKDRTAEISKQKEQIEEQNKHITDSIRYAKRIQNAILPPNDYIESIMPNSFILYRPKDIVSGDFYWINELDKKVVVAAVDCTGHGVPGAFMSIVGSNQLNHAVNVINARKPSDILDALNEGVTETLREKGDASIRDGMDIAICSVDYKNNKVQYAGAYNPLYLIRNNELLQFKADKFPIGQSGVEEFKKYTNNEIEVQKGDTLYIFSDGYADQFGGERGRKFMYKAFRNLLTEISNEPMDKQKEILNKTIDEWKGDIEQVDDIIVIGIKI
ncbi:MAG: SpoIIE family protein phosphatase [Bacteroidales bacterium]|nr:SpoIIE family protein phosphatase [Bacteroidales bacterium]